MMQNKTPTTSISEESENVKVAVRVRPLNKKELRDGLDNITSVDKKNNVISLAKPGLPDEPPKSFKFDYIFPEDCTQVDLYKQIAYPIVEKVFRGYNGTIFAYGQTGTGKTYTMIGKQNDPMGKGILPNTFRHIFDKISSCDNGKSAIITVSYLEIYNEDVRDLLSSNPNAKLELRERLDTGIYVKDLTAFTVKSIQETNELMKKGNSNRFTRSTLMNDISSRSHAIFTMTIEYTNDESKTMIGKLNLVDLAGSERLSRTHATGDRLKEASNINQSLSVLGIVISALINEKSTHIPYRNSKLTRLLQDSLGGNSQTAMIAMISPSENDYEETICTLRYASRVKYIKNRIRANAKSKKNMITFLEQEINKLLLLVVSLRDEKAALVLERNKDKEQLEALYEDYKRQDEECQRLCENLPKTENFGDMKLKDFESDEEEDDQPDDERNEMEPATKKFCEFLARQTPENTFSSLLKTCAKQQFASEYALRNFKLYNMTINHFKTESINKPLSVLNRSFSTPNLSQINTTIQINRSKSLTRLSIEELRDDFIEINSIRVGLTKLQTILMAENPQNGSICVPEESEEKMDVTIAQENPSSSLRHSGNHFKKYIANIEALKQEVNDLSFQKNDLEKRNEELQSLLIEHQNKLEHPAKYHINLNSMVIKYNELVAENQSLKEHNANINNQLEYYKTKLNEKYNSDLELTQRKISSLNSFNQELEMVNQSLRDQNVQLEKQMEYYRSKVNEQYSAAQLSQKQANLLQIENQTLKDRNINLQQKVEQLTNHCQEMNSQIAIYQETNNSYSATIGKLEYDQETLKIQLENMRASYNELYNVELAPCKERMNLFIESCNEKENQIHILRKQIMDYEKQLGFCQGQYKEKVKSQIKLTQDYNALLEKYNHLNSHCLKIQCDLDVLREKDIKLLETLDNYEQKAKQHQTDAENYKKILKTKDLELQAFIDERKKVEDKLTLSHVKISQLEESIKTIKNQKSKLHIFNRDEEKKLEEYRKEILKLKNTQTEQVNHHERRMNDLLYTNNKLEAQHKSLADELEALKAHLNQEITLRKETSQKLKIREQVLKKFKVDYYNITQSHIKHVELNKEKIRKIQELEEKVSHLKTENKNLQETIRVKICNSLQKTPEAEDSFNIITKFRSTVNGCDNVDVTSMKMKLKKAEQTHNILIEKDKQIAQLKNQLADLNVKLENAQKNLESAKGSCECKRATRTSLSNRRRHEKNLLLDSRRNIPSEDVKNDVIGQERPS
ncbi:Kinesin [Oryctes borbonicus]|uniref:Kinesin n=1 Tax=Oryctes borbonicus TaxID=1629725 RepID=A0A0T6ATN4_9SCAR|nr:Kinesin [Oryctes borbonicus]